MKLIHCFLSMSLALATGVSAGSVTFSAMGCGPYKDPDQVALEYHIAQENRTTKKSAFLVHLGDINTGALAKSGKLGEDRYSSMAKWLTAGSSIPAYIVPGDNEWNDRPDPDVGWAHWTKHLLRLEETIAPSWKTERQEVREENFAFVHGGVLFIGLNLVGGAVHDPIEWATRFKQDNDWVEAQYEKHKGSVRAAVLFAQANVIGQGRPKVAVNLLFSPFTTRFAELSAAFEKPVLFIHSDGHNWTKDRPWKKAQNVMRIQVDLIQAKFPPVQGTVKEKPGEDGEIFSFDRRLNDPAWKSGKKVKASSSKK